MSKKSKKSKKKGLKRRVKDLELRVRNLELQQGPRIEIDVPMLIEDEHGIGMVLPNDNDEVRGTVPVGGVSLEIHDEQVRDEEPWGKDVEG